jgi:hypothetical protein
LILDYVRYVDVVLQDESASPMDQMHSIVLRAYATGNIIHYTVEGSSPENYLPEPHSLKSIDRLPNAIREVWLAAYMYEINFLLNMNSFEHPTNYQNELCKVWMADFVGAQSQA